MKFKIQYDFIERGVCKGEGWYITEKTNKPSFEEALRIVDEEQWYGRGPTGGMKITSVEELREQSQEQNKNNGK